MRSLKHFWWQQIIDFCNALASAPASCLHKLVLIDNLQDAFLHGPRQPGIILGFSLN